MGSLVQQYSSNKLLGKVYTPQHIVRKVLDEIGYTGEGILQKRILDPACGDGCFLIEIVKRIVSYSPREDLLYNLSFVHGWDIDKQAIEDCIKQLDFCVLPYNLQVRWKVYERNALSTERVSIDVLNERDSLERESLAREILYEYEYIAGNPPYIRVQHLDDSLRRYIQRHFTFCRAGSTDIYIAFFELCYNLLVDGGTCGLITPNTWLYTEAGRYLRRSFRDLGCLRKVINYGDIQLFAGVSTYSAISIFSRDSYDSFRYEKAQDTNNFSVKDIRFSDINDSLWLSDTNKEEGGKLLGDICDIHVGITTLMDKVYILEVIEGCKDYILVRSHFMGEIKLERDILRPIVKASKLKSGDEEIRENVLFPYEKVGGRHTIIEEGRLREEYPLCYKYLVCMKELLANRDNGTPIKPYWYAFGRSQSLDSSFGKKILFSPMNQRPNFILHSNEGVTFYSGYCIKYGGDYEWLLGELNSERMERHIEQVSRSFRDGWKAYNKRVIERFPVNI